jgi:FkbM family methyltransferase
MIRSIDGRWGKCYYFGKDEYVGRSVHNYGEYNPDETEYIIQLAETAQESIEHDMLVLDIGANIGCIAQALEHEGFQVIAFEPQPEVYKVLKRNAPRSDCYNLGLGSKAEIAKMPKIRYDDKNNVGGMSIGSRGVLGTIDVEVRTLDSFNFQNVGLMKIDVEGYEEEVLRGADETIARCKPILYIEDDRVSKSAGLHKFLEELGYTWTQHNPPLYREENFFKFKQNIWDKNYVSKNIDCRPQTSA